MSELGLGLALGGFGNIRVLGPTVWDCGLGWLVGFIISWLVQLKRVSHIGISWCLITLRLQSIII